MNEQSPQQPTPSQPVVILSPQRIKAFESFLQMAPWPPKTELCRAIQELLSERASTQQVLEKCRKALTESRDMVEICLGAGLPMSPFMRQAQEGSPAALIDEALALLAATESTKKEGGE